MKTTIKVEGLRELGLRLKQLNIKMQRRIASRATGAAARIVKKAAKANIRQSGAVDTELLESAVIMKRLPLRETEGATAGHIVTIKKKVYTQDNPRGDRHTRRSGVFNEYGTVKMPAQPFMRRALYANRTAAIEAMAERVREELKKEGG